MVMKMPDPDSVLPYSSKLPDGEYGLSPARIEEIANDTAILQARVRHLARTLAFEAEPWGFGIELLRLAQSNET